MEPVTRRRLLQLGLALPVFVACSRAEPTGGGDATSKAPPGSLAPTPSCDDGDEETTLPQTEGPFFTPSSPERSSLLEPGLVGTALTVSGAVLAPDCRPIAGALLDFWQADDGGVYDNEGFRLRGHQFADDRGRWRLETIVPGLYPGRTRHIHVKAQAPDQAVLTTQLYFPDEPANAADGIFDPALLMAVTDRDGERVATFDFVLG